MQIVQIIHGVHNLSAGPTHSVARLADELCVQGQQASILTLGRAPAAWPYRAPLTRHQGTLERHAGISPALLGEIRRHAADRCVLHGHGIWRLTNLFPLLLRRNTPARIVCSPRGALSPWSLRYKSPLKRPFWHLLQHPALQRSHCFHATSPAEYEHVRRAGLRAPVAVLPNGIDIPEIAPGRPRGRRAVFLGRLDPVKGLDLLLPAWTAVAGRHDAWELVIAGPLGGDYANSVRALADRLRSPRVSFAGEVRGAAKRELLSGASLFILPSYSENFGLVAAEALAYGVPVITTTETPWADIVRHGCGWYVPPREDELHAALDDAMGRPLAELHDMGRRGRAWMQHAYGWPSVAERMILTYQWLLLGGSRPDWVIDA